MKNFIVRMDELLFALGIDHVSNRVFDTARSEMWCPLYMNEIGDYFAAFANLYTDELNDEDGILYTYNTGITKADLEMAKIYSAHMDRFPSDTFHFVDYIETLSHDLTEDGHGCSTLHPIFAMIAAREMVERWISEAGVLLHEMKTARDKSIDDAVESHELYLAINYFERYYTEVVSRFVGTIGEGTAKFRINQDENFLEFEYKKGKMMHYYEPVINDTNNVHLLTATPNFIKKVEAEIPTYMLSTNHVLAKIEMHTVVNPLLSHKNSQGALEYDKVTIPVVVEIQSMNDISMSVSDLVEVNSLYEFADDGKTILFGYNEIYAKIKTDVVMNKGIISYPYLRFMVDSRLSHARIKFINNYVTNDIGLIAVDKEGYFSSQPFVKLSRDQNTDDLPEGKLTIDHFDHDVYKWETRKYPNDVRELVFYDKYDRETQPDRTEHVLTSRYSGILGGDKFIIDPVIVKNDDYVPLNIFGKIFVFFFGRKRLKK